VGTGGFAADKVNVVGKGESSPITQAADCKGNRPTAKLIACLQPDRRVDIEVSGLQ
jgi:OOP family OmpA-OmpF porin